ncbi:methyltransferase-like protein 5 isoform X1 [Selaginella moellendorffii]|uniref:methyltransferase-like protein 5 isoform X1 n=1 Tax=Selaginella moellendorffii TaxID=88036 RepID=UPI000D1CBF80|nr:methyltransferase-like protein 5 isoform X1 [Selaginella moellendorffii]XP_024539872.1 methyltransferase-like protein 5 isoform X1 [Selaginella moellendorffii]|eukprot:XP_024518329.1 methyltransferase-like protein 5 isoform X1 [Selaginella moellendorffii]
MKLKQLESELGHLVQFQSPKIELEQYPTGAHIASRMMYMVSQILFSSVSVTNSFFCQAESNFGDICGKSIADLGCGCGTLGVAASLLDASYVIGFDQDLAALDTAQENCRDLEIDMDFVQCDVKSLGLTRISVDTVVMNPPFGTRRKGADMEFLSVALKIARTAIYSLHKSSTRQHVKRAALQDLGAKTAEVLFELRFDLKSLYKFHKKQELDIAVDLWRFTV